MNVKIEGYQMEIDPLHRNVWPVRWDYDGRVIGEVIEHITVAFDGGAAPHVDWSWKLDDTEALRLGKHWAAESQSTLRYRSHRSAFAAFTSIHRSSVDSAKLTAKLFAERTAAWLDATGNARS